MKKLRRFIALCCLLPGLGISVARAQTPDASADVSAFQSLVEAGVHQIVESEGTYYAYLQSCEVYQWSAGQEPRLLCALPQWPSRNVDPSSVIADERWADCVSFLAAGPGELWGVNIFSGKAGKITEAGMQWQEPRLDVSAFNQERQGWPLRVARAWVAGGSLYVYVALDDGPYPKNNYEMYALDLQSGARRALNIQNAQAVCPYGEDSALLLQYRGDAWGFDEIHLSTGTVQPSRYPTFAGVESSPIGGLAYDPQGDRLYFTAQSQVWVSEKAGAFVPMATIPMPDLVGEAPAFVLPDGRYALSYGAFYVREPGRSPLLSDTLTLAGCMDQTIYESFAAANPDIHVEMNAGLLSADEIVQRLITGDGAADLYATFADNTFRAIVQKGYAADLSASEILTSDIREMYPNIQSAITDEAGNPIAYPYQLLLSHWQVCLPLWTLIYGDLPLPQTYGQFLDAMLLWEEEYAEEYPDIAFSGDFDHANWLKKIVNAYAQQYGKAGEPFDLDTPMMRELLEKLERVCAARRLRGANTAFLDQESFIPRLDLFVTAGFNNVLLEPAEPPREQIKDVSAINFENAVYTDMPAMVFTEEETPLIPGRLLVWFVNPYSQRRELAIRYLECAAQMEVNPRTYYAAHPSCSAPVMNEGAAERIAQTQEQILQLEQALQTAPPEEAVSIEDSLAQLEALLQTQERMQWLLSEKAIAAYRDIAPSIRFFEENPYVAPDKSRMLDQLDSLYQRYANGRTDMDLFLQEINEKMHMLYLEGR